VRMSMCGAMAALMALLVGGVPVMGELSLAFEEVGRGRPPYEETPAGVTTNVPAFPGAEGFGAYARGGRGGRVSSDDAG